MPVPEPEYKVVIDYVRPGVLMIKYGEKLGNEYVWTHGERLALVDGPGNTISHLFHIMAERLHDHYFEP